MSNNVDVSQLYEVGNKKFFAASLLANGDFGDKEYHQGLMEVKIEFKSDATDLSADDNLAYIRLNTPLTGEGTIKFAVLPYNVYSKFFDVTTDKNGAIVIKSKNKAKEVAFGFYSTAGDGSESMFTIYRAVFKLPALSSVSFDGQTIRDLTLAVNIYPFDYIDASNAKEQITYSILNSKMHADIWDKVQDEVYLPDCELPEPDEEPDDKEPGDDEPGGDKPGDGGDDKDPDDDTIDDLDGDDKP